MLPRATEYLFERIAEKTEFKEIGMVVSFLEVYLDRVRDLGRAYFDHKNASGSEFPTINPQEHAEGMKGSSTRPRPLSAQPGRNLSRPTSASSLPRRPQSAGFHQPAISRTDVDDARKGTNNFEHQDLAIHETAHGQVYVKDLTLIPVENIGELTKVINMGVAMRQTHETKLNANSSRSHTVFSINVVQKDRRMPDADVISGVLHFVDLAGSERLARSKSEGKRFQEAVLINSSLSALGKVVLSLASDGKNKNHIPYRDSKLTRILQNALGGNSYTTLLTTINPSSDNYEESLNSLQFADRCKNVFNKPTINYIDPEKGSQDRRIKRLLAEITDLKQQLEVAKASAKARLQYQNEDLGLDGAPDVLKSADARAKEEAEKQAKAAAEQAAAAAAARLKKELEEKEAAKQKAKGMKDAFDQAKRDMEAREKARRTELLKLKDAHSLALEDLVMCKQLSEQTAQSQAEMYRCQSEQHLHHSRGILAEKVKQISNLPALMKENGEAVDFVNAGWTKRHETVKSNHTKSLKSLHDGLTQQNNNVKNQYNQWLTKKEDDLQKTIDEFKRHQREKGRELKEYQNELLAMFQLTGRLTRIIEDMESGVYPHGYHSGIRSVIIPQGVKPRPPTKEKFRKLFQLFGESNAKADIYDMVKGQGNADNISTSPPALGLESVDSRKLSPSPEPSSVREQFDAAAFVHMIVNT